jgi:transposase InsO family protein
MSMERIGMSQRERDVVKVMSLVLSGQRTGVEAARLLGRSERPIRRIRRRLEKEGDAGVIHRLRGRSSNRRIKTALRSRAVSICRNELAGFGPTLATEKLAERGLPVCSETLRGWLLAEGLWQRKRRRDRHRSRRQRKDCFGEMVQMDTSIHDWLEGRGETFVLTAMIDDATGRILARFYPGETTEGHMDLLGRWISKHGRPLSLYTDRDGIYRTEGRDGASRPTQFGRALKELDTELILAYSPQAKGRVERLFGTLQDRWVKELRLAKVKTLDQANALLEKELIPAFNRRFVVKAAGDNDALRGWRRGDCLQAILSIQHRRTVAND